MYCVFVVFVRRGDYVVIVRCCCEISDFGVDFGIVCQSVVEIFKYYDVVVVGDDEIVMILVKGV